VETPTETIYRFGLFEVNATSGELLKQGRRVRLQEQPFRLLVILLEQAGEVVSREEIQRRLWDGNTFVDFEGSLRVAVRKLRDALGDDADSPRYIETIPKRGYRFLGPAVRPHAAQAGAPVAAPEINTGSQRTADASSSTPWTQAIRIGVVIAFAAGALLFLFGGTLFPSTKILTEKDTVVLADFANSTGDPVFDGTLRQGLTVQLEQSPFLSMISDESIKQTLELMNQPANTRLVPEVAREVCERTGSTAVLNGSIANLGSQYVLGLRASNCRTGKILAEEQGQAARKEDVLDALGQLASKFRTHVGESLATVQQHNTPLAEATTPSLEALKAYSSAWEVLATQGEASAIPFFKKSVEIDPQFAIAYASLALMYGSIGESALATENAGRAYALRSHASDKERFFITAYYDGRATGNQEKAQQTCEAWAETYPREKGPPHFLSGFIFPASGKFEKAAEEARKAIQLNPDDAVAYTMLATHYAALNRLPDAEGTIRVAAARKIELPLFLVIRYDLAFLKGDQAEMDRVAAQAQGKTGAEDWIADHQGFVHAYSGQLREARRLSSHAADLAQQSAHRERAALFEAGASLWEAMSGNAAEAKRTATKALALARNREVDYGSAFALALSGDSSQSQALANDLEKNFPEDTAIRFSYLPSLRALAALNHGDSAKAVEILQVAIPNELGQPRSALQGFFGALYPIYVRGLAYLAAHQGQAAAAEFQKIIDHPGITTIDPMGALAYLQQGRAYAMSGDTAKAKDKYQEFLSRWKNADPDLPLLKQAKAEFAKLQQ
jgi:eukaryotic-like serine/threonine-protein kinase